MTAADRTVLDNPRLLLVEDNAATAAAMLHLLDNKGYELGLSSTVTGSLNLLQLYGYAVVLLDLKLADGDGLKVLRYVRENRLKTKVCIITGAIHPERLAEAEAAGPDLILGKPFVLEHLFGFLARARMELAAAAGADGPKVP